MVISLDDGHQPSPEVSYVTNEATFQKTRTNESLSVWGWFSLKDKPFSEMLHDKSENLYCGQNKQKKPSKLSEQPSGQERLTGKRLSRGKDERVTVLCPVRLLRVHTSSSCLCVRTLCRQLGL